MAWVSAKLHAHVTEAISNLRQYVDQVDTDKKLVAWVDDPNWEQADNEVDASFWYGYLRGIADLEGTTAAKLVKLVLTDTPRKRR